MKKLLVISLLALTGCGGGSGDDSGSGDFTSGGSASHLVGVWDATTDEGVDGVDEAYIGIDEDGVVTLYDYAGDSYDDWGDCYWINEADHLDAVRNNLYDSEVYEELQITVSGNTMTLSGLDDGDEFSESFIRSNRTVSSFSPECSDSFENARALIPEKKIKVSVVPSWRK